MVVQNWGGLIENQEIDIVSVKAGHDLRDELCPIPECAFFNDSFIDVNSDVDVAVGLSPAVRVRSEQIRLKNLRPGFEQARDSLVQLLAGFRLHVGSLLSIKKRSPAGDRFDADRIRNI